MKPRKSSITKKKCNEKKDGENQNKINKLESIKKFKLEG
jgi:hypothetical protein